MKMTDTNFYINTSFISALGVGLYDFFNDGLKINACLADSLTVFLS